MLFNRFKSPTYINDGNGWTAEQALIFLRDHDLRMSDRKDTADELRFVQYEREAGPVKLREIVDGVTLVLESDR